MAPSGKAGPERANGGPGNSPNAGMTPSGARTNDDKAAQGTTPQNSATQPQSGTQTQSPPNAADRNATSSSQANVNLSSEQRTRIRETVIKQPNAPRISRNEVNFNLSVGTVVPRTVRMAVLPAVVIEIHPAWRGYSYILVGDEMVVIEPGTLRIVAILPA